MAVVHESAPAPMPAVLRIAVQRRDGGRHVWLERPYRHAARSRRSEGLARDVRRLLTSTKGSDSAVAGGGMRSLSGQALGRQREQLRNGLPHSVTSRGPESISGVPRGEDAGSVLVSSRVQILVGRQGGLPRDALVAGRKGVVDTTQPKEPATGAFGAVLWRLRSALCCPGFWPQAAPAVAVNLVVQAARHSNE